MSWINESILWLLALVAVPIVLHFLLRERVQKVAFSAVRFLRGHSRESLTRRKWLEWLLTALRVVCVALLVIAFARPFFGKGPQQSNSGQRLTVVMLDASRSMTYAGRFAEGQKIARDAIDSADDSSAFRIVTFADAASVRVSEAGDKAAAKDAIDHAVVTAAGTDLPGVLERVFSDLRRRPGGGEVHLISDLQQTALPPNRAAPALPPGFQFHVHAVTDGPRNPGGVSVIGAAPYMEVLPGERNLDVSARIVNRGPARDVVAQLVVAGKVIGSRVLQLPQNGEAVTSINGTVKEPGEHRAQIIIRNPGPDGKDGPDLRDAPTVLADDNRFNLVLHVVEKIHVAIVNGHPAAEPSQDAAFFFSKALTAGEESPFEVTIVPALPAKLEDVDVVVLAGVNSLPKQDVARLSEFLSKGGGLLVGVAPGTDLNVFNQSLAAVLPARLGAVKDDAAGRFLIPADLKHPLVQRMVAEGSGDLTTSHFRNTFELKDTQDAHVVLRFDDNRPALVEKSFGHGATILLAAPLDLRGGDFPLRAIFVPFARESVRILSARAEQADPPALGETLAIPAGAELKLPDGSTVHASAGEDLTQTISQPGFYQIVRNGQSTLYAVNVDPRESDLSAREPADVEAMVSPQQTAEVRLTSAGIERVLPPDYKVESERRGNIGIKILVILLALTAIELGFARFVSRK